MSEMKVTLYVILSEWSMYIWYDTAMLYVSSDSDFHSILAQINELILHI